MLQHRILRSKYQSHIKPTSMINAGGFLYIYILNYELTHMLITKIGEGRSMKHSKQIIKCYLFGLIVFIMSKLMINGLISKYMIINYTPKTTQEWILTGILILTSWIGNVITLLCLKDKLMTVSAINAAIMIMTLVIGSIYFDGEYQCIALRLCAVLSGVILSYFMILFKKPPKRFRKRRSS